MSAIELRLLNSGLQRRLRQSHARQRVDTRSVLRYTSQWRSQGVRLVSGPAPIARSAGGSAENVGAAQAVHDGVRTKGVLVQAGQRRYELVARAVLLGMASQLTRLSWETETLERFLYLGDL
jgi:hypothetical protein